VLTARKLLILRMARRAKKAPLPIPLYVYCTKIFSLSHSAKPHQERSIPILLPAPPKHISTSDPPFQGSGISLIVNWRTPVISINLFSRKSSSPDFLTCSTTGMSRSHCSCRLRPLSRIRRDHREVMIESILPDCMIRSTCEANVRHRLGIHTDAS
jgi:hypothetical protein